MQLRSALVLVFSILTLAVPGWSTGPDIPLAADRNPDPEIVEIDLDASEVDIELISGTSTRMLAFNGTVPGPLIDLEVGQRLIVHFTNSLPFPMTIHWHGVHVPANMDGSNISQESVPPGGEFTYDFQAIAAGTFWYHPHVSTNVMVEKGLYGPMVIRSTKENLRLRAPRGQEHILMVDDIKLDDGFEVAEFATDLANGMDPAERAAELFNSREGNLFLVNGQVIPTLEAEVGVPMRLRLISPANGRFMRLSVPGHTMYRVGGDGGLLNRSLELAPIGMVQTDDGAMVSDPDPAKGILLTPAERADIVFTPLGECGDILDLEWHDFPRGRHRTFYDADGNIGFDHAHDDGKRPKVVVARIELQCEDVYSKWWKFKPRKSPNTKPILPIPVPSDVEPMVVAFGHGRPMPNGNIVFFNAVRKSAELHAAVEAALAEAEDPGNVGPIPGMIMPPMFEPLPFPALTPEDAPTATFGETRIWYLVNFTGGDHDFHPHGFSFQALETILLDLDGEDPAERVERRGHPLEWKDTIIVPARPAEAMRSFSILKLAVRFDDQQMPRALRRDETDVVAFGKVPETLDPLDPTEGFSGGWVAHCHLLEHADTGMMSFYNLLPRE